MNDWLIDLVLTIVVVAILGIVIAAGTGPRYMDTPTASDVREATERCERLDLRADVRMDYWGDMQVACVP